MIWRGVRVFMLVLGIGALTWYGKGGGSDFFTDARVIRVSGSAGGYSVDCLAVKRDTVVAGGVAVAGALPRGGEPALPVGRGGFARRDAFPFADSVMCVRLSFEGAEALVCDSAIFAPRPADARSAEFWEKLDLLVVPSAKEEEVLAVRGQFRPKFLAVIPPCAAPSSQNIVCDGDGVRFRYDFKVVRGKIKYCI